MKMFDYCIGALPQDDETAHLLMKVDHEIAEHVMLVPLSGRNCGDCRAERLPESHAERQEYDPD